MYNTIGEFLRKLRLEHRLTQKKVAEKLDISRQAYAYYEHSSALPDTDMLLKLVPLYKVSLDTFLMYYPHEIAHKMSQSVHHSIADYEQIVYPEFLTFFTEKENMKKYHYLNHSEKELLFLFQKLPEAEQKELLLWTYFKSTVCSEKI